MCLCDLLLNRRTAPWNLFVNEHTPHDLLTSQCQARTTWDNIMLKNKSHNGSSHVMPAWCRLRVPWTILAAYSLDYFTLVRLMKTRTHNWQDSRVILFSYGSAKQRPFSQKRVHMWSPKPLQFPTLQRNSVDVQLNLSENTETKQKTTAWAIQVVSHFIPSFVSSSTIVLNELSCHVSPLTLDCSEFPHFIPWQGSENPFR